MDNGTKAGTIGGTLLTVFFNLPVEDLVKTAVLAAVGRDSGEVDHVIPCQIDQ